jgi:membrane protein required for colicin V production
LISLLAWIVALVLAVQWGPLGAGAIAGGAIPPSAAAVLAFLLVFLAIVIGGAVVGLLVAKLLRAVGLGFVDRLFGAVFGLLRAGLLLLVAALIAGLTSFPRHDWWQNSMSAPRLADIVLALRPYWPADWADRLDYSAAGVQPDIPEGAIVRRGHRT